MRLDKFLKYSQIVKRRVIAQELIERGAILLNNQRIKPSTNVKIEDKIYLRLGKRQLEIEVIETKEENVKQMKTSAYKVISELIDEKF
jgi:ribosomal 50S subunit-recycling heat shock protein